MENNSIESYQQRQKAQFLTHDPTATPFATHPGARIQLDLGNPGGLASNETALIRYPGKTLTGLNYYTVPESEKLTKMRQRKSVKMTRKETKNVKQVTVTQGAVENYNIDNILQELGESEESSKKNKGPKKAKAERKRSNRNKKEFKAESSVTPSSTTSEDEDEDEEEELELETASEQPQTSLESDNIEHNSNTAVSLNRQASRSTEDLFTPVIKKHKWKVKKSVTKDDSGHTYSSSSSSASSTTSTSATASHASNYSSLSAKPKYNLRRKSALRPSQSFDTMKSTASSVASDDTLEATPHSSNAKDHLDLATDFPPLASTSAAEAGAPPVSDQYVPKWVIKSNSDSTFSTTTSNNTNNSSAVIDASDQPTFKLNQPPPDVTVVLQQPSSKQCTSGLPDIAAQAPMVMNTTNSSSGVSSNAGDLTPPQTLMSEPSFFPLDNVETSFKSNSPAVVMFNSIQDCSKSAIAAEHPGGGDVEGSNAIEFGFDVNVLDFIGNNQVNEDDEAIVSFGKQFVNSPEPSGTAAGHDSGIVIPEHEVSGDQTIAVQSEPDSEPIEQQNSNNNNNNQTDTIEAVKFPNYAQVVQYVAASWKKVEKELKQGLAQKY